MQSVLALALIVVIAAACAAGPEPASPRASLSVVGSVAPSAPPATGAASTNPPPTAAPATDPPATDPPPTAPPATSEASGRPDPATFLQVCREPDPANADAIACADAVETALAAPELAGARVTRVDVRAACEVRPCAPNAVVALAATVLSDREPTEVVVVRGADGGLAVASVRPGHAPAAPAFTPPAAALAALPGAPVTLDGRPAYPLCGEETAPMGGPYDGAARRCFLNGVLAGSPVEFASHTSGTEGGAVTTLVRFAGTGGIEYVTGEAGRWTRAFTGIKPATGGLVFDLDGMATRREPVQ